MSGLGDDFYPHQHGQSPKRVPAPAPLDLLPMREIQRAGTGYGAVWSWAFFFFEKKTLKQNVAILLKE